MLEEGSVRSADPEGEGFLRGLPWPVDTPGGRYFAEFDDEAPVTREGHSYLMANTRLCLGVEVLSGKEHAARHALPGLWQMLDKLPRTQWPTLLRGDCSYGNEVFCPKTGFRTLQ
jgi:hypothetical protein